MNAPFELRVYKDRRLVYAGQFTGPIELGRQMTGEKTELYCPRREGGQSRLVLARMHEGGVSRKHVLLEPLDNGLVRIINESATQAIYFTNGALEPQGVRDVPFPARFFVAGRTVRVEQVEAPFGMPQKCATIAPQFRGP